MSSITIPLQDEWTLEAKFDDEEGYIDFFVRDHEGDVLDEYNGTFATVLSLEKIIHNTGEVLKEEDFSLKRIDVDGQPVITVCNYSIEKGFCTLTGANSQVLITWLNARIVEVKRRIRKIKEEIWKAVDNQEYDTAAELTACLSEGYLQ